MDISFIIPAHNAGKYLNRVYDSIKTLDVEKEIIIVENNSDDDTFDVANAIAATDSQVVVLKSSPGVSNARNEGIKNAKGKWICFVDADDYLLPDAPRLMKVAIKHFADDDFVMFGFKKGSETCSFGKKTVRYRGNRLKKLRCKMFENPTMSMTVWGKLYRRSVLQNSDVLFNPKLSHSEDRDFLVRYTAHCNSMIVCEYPLYNFIIDKDNVSHDYDNIEDYTKAMAEFIDYINKAEPDMKDSALVYVLMHLNLVAVREIFDVDKKVSFKDKKARLKGLCEEESFKNAINMLNFKSVVVTPKLWVVLLCKARLYSVASVVYKLKAMSNNRKEKKL